MSGFYHLCCMPHGTGLTGRRTVKSSSTVRCTDVASFTGGYPAGMTAFTRGVR
jgi:hypothetical protein